MDPSVQILEPELKIRLVVLPRDAIHPGGGFALQRVECRLQGIDIDVVEECGEPLLLSLPCCLSYAVQRLGHANPALRPVRALLARVPLGPRPWLHRLRSRLPGLVRSQTSLDRASAATAPRLPATDHRPEKAYGRSKDLPVSAQGASVHARVSDHAGLGGHSQYRACRFCLPSSEQRRHSDL